MTRSILSVTALCAALAGCASTPAPAHAPTDVHLAGTDTDGQARDYDAALARGETVALVFWQTWCESCRDEAPAIQAAAAAERGRIHFVGVVPGKDATVDAAEVAATRKAWGYAFPQLRDKDLALSRALGVRGTPTIVVLGKGRSVAFHGHRPPADWAPLRGAAFDPEAPGGAPTSGAAGGAGQPAGECQDGVCPLPDAGASKP